ncbi:MAG TPA: sulfatase-like hydrolase/transferase, partial [Candidatus Acidoferrales bacterium]|nr:sulfatase-like hydrolase/transferase [Candidatus Acidoferrales bacterium]
DNGFVDPPRTPQDGYHLTEDLADTAVRMVQDQQQATPAKPFFLYFAPGAMHAPHHAPRAWIDAYRGSFDGGWEAWRQQAFQRQLKAGIVPEGTTLTERPSWVPDWNALPAEQRRLFARGMEAFAGFLSHTDAQIGRLLAMLGTLGVADNTLVLILSDNGASAEGGPIGSFNEHRFVHDRVDDIADTLQRVDEIGGFRAYNHYAWGWAWAGNAPLRLWKRYTWLGGVRTPLIARWPKRLADHGSVRPQFCHAVDILPTVLDATGVEAQDVVDGVTQQPFDGASLLAMFDDANAAAPRHTQYFEMLGSRAIYYHGWKATTDHVGPQLTVERDNIPGSHDFESDHWSLFDLDNDFAEAHDLSAQHPEHLKILIEQWWMEAGRNNVLPLTDSFLGRVTALEPSPWGPRWRAVLRPGGGPVSEDALPPLGGGFRLLADVDIGTSAAGIVCALGDWSNGWAWYFVDGRPVLTFNILGEVFRYAASEPLPAGRHTILAEYAWARKDSVMRLRVGKQVIAEGPLPRRLPMRWQIGGAGLLVGRDRGFPVCDDYEAPFPFRGTIERVLIEVPALAPRDAIQETEAALHRE